MAELVPAPRVHADLAATPALGATHEQRAAPMIEIAFGERQRFLDTQPGAPKDHDHATQGRPCAPSPAVRVTARISSIFGGSAGIAETLVSRRSAGLEAGHRRGRSAATSAIE
jgi:hypothetical protein